MIKTTIVLILVGLGAVFSLIAAIGVLRFRDIYMRMHTATKVPSFVMFLLLSAAALHFGSLTTALVCLFTIVIIFVTAPVASHMVSRVAHRLGVYMWEGTACDKLAEDEREEEGGEKTEVEN